MSTTKRQKRARRGSVTAFSAVLALALLVLGLGFIFICLYMGGQRETKNATDAGALNVGKQALDEPSVMLSPAGAQHIFFDCTVDSTNNNKIGDNKINLHRINRVWAKAMLIAINADAAQSDGNAGSGTGNASDACQAAQEISDALATKLTTPSNLHGFFQDLSAANSVRMIGTSTSTQVKSGSGWQTSLMDRDCESNITLAGTPSDSFFLPPGYSLPSNYSTKSTRNPLPGEVSNTYFLKGYSPLKIGNNTFWQVPFKWDDKPHLVSATPFQAAQASANPLSWNKAVPNAFSVEGQALKSGALGETASSWVLSNPRQPFKLSAPHTFLHIKIDEMKAKWYFYPVPPLAVKGFSDETYDFDSVPKTSSGTSMPLGGVLCANVTPPPQELGLDVVARPLGMIIFGTPAGNTSKVKGYMVNRINEVISKPGVTKTSSDLDSLLNDPATIAYLYAGEKDFYIFSNDGENLKCLPKALAIGAAPWLVEVIGNAGDGNDTKIIDDAEMLGGPFLPHVPEPVEFCSPTPGVNWSWVEWHKDVWWKPGTGYNGSLGEIRVTRWNEVHTVGVCNPL